MWKTLENSFPHTRPHARAFEIPLSFRNRAPFRYKNVKLVWNTCR